MKILYLYWITLKATFSQDYTAPVHALWDPPVLNRCAKNDEVKYVRTFVNEL